MKLLDKKAIAAQKTVERETEVKEGIKLARKVDALREMASTEESKLTKFRMESLAVIKAEMAAIEVEKNKLQTEVSLLQQEKELLKKPLDAEWNALHQAYATFEHEREHFKEKADNYIELIKVQSLRLADLVIQEENINEKDKKASENLLKTEETRLKTDAILSNLEVRQHQFEENMLLKNKDMLGREAHVAVKERELNLKASDLESREKDIISKTILLNDREKTIEREIKRQQNDTRNRTAINDK